MHSLIFFGSDQYSCIVLASLIPASPAGRSRLSSFSLTVVTDKREGGTPVESLARSHSLPIIYYDKSTIFHQLSTIYNLRPSIGLSASFPHLLPPNIIELFQGRLYNLHPSLLPQYRNVSPVPYSLAMGDTVAGITLFQIANGIDNGMIMAQSPLPVSPTHTTPTLLNELFALGAGLFERYLANPTDPDLTKSIPTLSSQELIFTKKITSQSGFIEWVALRKLLEGNQIALGDTNNELIKLRLTHHPDRVQNILPDLVRALTGYDRVWSLVPTPKGELRITLTYQPSTIYDLPSILISGKPKPISFIDFTKYYLNG